VEKEEDEPRDSLTPRPAPAVEAVGGEGSLEEMPRARVASSVVTEGGGVRPNTQFRDEVQTGVNTEL